MSKLQMIFFGYLDTCTDRDGLEYQDNNWRAEYFHKPGLITIFASEYKAPGKMFLYFFPNEPESPFQKWLRTSAGDLTYDKDVYIMTTKSSIYTFIKDDMAVPEDDKILLFANSHLNPNTKSVKN